MPANRNVQSFFELRAGLQGMQEFAEAALQYMDDNGIALMTRKQRKANSNGHGAVDVSVLAERAKTMFSNRGGKRKQPKRTEAADPDGKHVTAKEAGKMLKMSEANVRLMWNDGRLPKPTFENRPWSKSQPDRKKSVQVIPVDAVIAFKEQAKAEAAAGA